ncbi:MAG: ABC transporter permease [Rhodospirillales bacterium]|jgi:phospholipid/cholesterol/gamma-HCH transport system permease protein|nr:ABC transporter [Rhodospirillaceae bacterium]MDP6430057.1 ABC transporter permease [Rhodospirillales bacterium]MDP6642732.1 ABC transporter permease [Rhodospirillales bacterium]MDP6843257.1 ABC transporter permease [Rhodospirillales bacterium]|tara:strand:+ start:753 stop:1568 length:816 start_codon:yes stop_codon:yes gene_type:complete
MNDGAPRSAILRHTEAVGRGSISMIEMMGHWGVLVGESLYWLIAGAKLGQPVRMRAVVQQMMEIGVFAIPIVALLSATIGVMLAIQGIFTLSIFGAESQVVFGISLSVVREFSALITGILVAGRSGSALAARLSTMQINQEIDALRVMGIHPVRYLVVPALLAMVVMLPALTFLSDMVALYAAGLYVSFDLGISQAAYWSQTIDALSNGDLWHGIGKSAIFAVLITLIGVVNGASVTGGAEGVGRVTTRAVVQAISAIVITDMIFAFIATR